MPRFPIKPLIELTKEQWRVLLQRVFEKEAKLTPKVAGKLMGAIEPQTEREMGTLMKRRALGGGEFETAAENLPIGEARAKYFASPESYTTPGRPQPSAKVLTQPVGVEEVGLTPEELAQVIGYQRQTFKPIIPPEVQQAAGVIRGEASAAEKEALIKRAGLTPEDIRPGVKLEQVLAEKGIQTGVEVPPVSQVMQPALIAEALWKDIGGAKSPGGKWWQELLNSSRGVIKTHFTTGKDYFVSSYYRWTQDPVRFRKNFPRETKLLEQAKKKFEESVGPGVE